MRPESFSVRKKISEFGPEESIGKDFVWGFVFFIGGIIFQGVLFLEWDRILPDLALWLGLLSFLIILHFGFSSLLFSAYRLLGWPVEPLFQSPLSSSSLREFWGQRWNLAFVDMDKRLFLPLLGKKLKSPAGKSLAVLGIFFLSGLLHEIGISYPAGAAWGGPFLYFILQGLFVLFEPIFMSKLGAVLAPKEKSLFEKLWVWVAILLPIPLLFHSAFLHTFILPYFEFGHNAINSVSYLQLLHGALLVCGLGHLLILVASFQVPQKLGWKGEFSRLGRFNQKIFWTYGGYIVFCIVSFALIDILNVQGLLQNNSSSLVIGLFIAVFWTARIIVDFGYFKHTDWPRGDEFVVGHTCLTALFCCLALTHWGLVAWQLTKL
jgi:alginate O-acetyltransferase complex protein AlgI